MQQAIELGLEYVRRAIASAPGLGAGHGPLNHFA
jgi:hydroxymethylpyrimidine/phosphomethylpyrimidine kinase